MLYNPYLYSFVAPAFILEQIYLVIFLFEETFRYLYLNIMNVIFM